MRTLTPYTGPVPLINCALSCLAGDELAHQDRRAEAFVLTPELVRQPAHGIRAAYRRLFPLPTTSPSAAP